MLYHFLHLEDDPLDAELVQSYLEEAQISCEVTVVSRAADYAAVLKRGPLDLIISDYSLPDFDGLGAFRLLRESDPNTPFILFSGALGEDRAVECLRLGITDYILKSHLERLIPAVQRALRETRERQERQRTEAALRESEERLRLASACIDGGVYDLNFVRDTTFRSERLIALFGEHPEVGGVAGIRQWWRGRVHPDDLPGFVALIAEAMKSQETYEATYRVLNCDDRYLTIWDRGKVLRDANGAVARLVGSQVNITERLEAGETLRARQTEIEDLNQRLQRAIAESHHRIKNNLQVLIALVDTMRLSDNTSAPPAEMERLARHIRGLATLHDILTNQTKTPGASLDSVSARLALERLIPALESSSVNLQITLDAEEIALTLKQCSALSLLTNELVSNALKHGKGRVALRVWHEANEVFLEVEDNGPGFPSDFDPIRAANTGLDLIESIGRWDLSGEITYRTGEAGGGIVRVAFPLHSDDPAVPLV